MTAPDTDHTSRAAFRATALRTKLVGANGGDVSRGATRVTGGDAEGLPGPPPFAGLPAARAPPTMVGLLLFPSRMTRFVFQRLRRLSFALRAATLLCGCASSPVSVARDAFTADHPCDELHAKTVSEWTNGGWQLVDVAGCGAEVQYTCSYRDRYPGSHEPEPYLACDERPRVSFRATDGGVLETFIEDGPEAARGTAIQSAAHDLACPPASITVLAKDAHGYANVLEGCGQRITYQVTGGDDMAPPASEWTTPPRARDYVEVGRTAVK
jgi:hypothetical protein